MKNSAKHIELLDHLRGVAILAVLFSHTYALAHSEIDVLPWAGWFRKISTADSMAWFLPHTLMQAGVPIFFVVSGFCIHLSFQQQGKSWGGFFIRRVFRIYPAYLATLVLVTLVLAGYYWPKFFNLELWKQLWTHLFLVHNFDTSTISGITPPLWSLAVEAQLYLLYPVLLGLVARLGWRPTMAILAGCELAIRIADGQIYAAGATDTTWCHVSWVLSHSPAGFWFSWALGAFIADAFLKKQPLPFTKSPLVPWFALVIACGYVKPMFSFLFLVFAMMTAVVTSRILNGTGPKIRVPATPLNLLGKIGVWSYSIYLLHQPVLSCYNEAIGWAVPYEYRNSAAAHLLVLVTWLVIFPASILWFKWLELPGIALGKRILQQMERRRCPMPKPE